MSPSKDNELITFSLFWENSTHARGASEINSTLPVPVL